MVAKTEMNSCFWRLFLMPEIFLVNRSGATRDTTHRLAEISPLTRCARWCLTEQTLKSVAPQIILKASWSLFTENLCDWKSLRDVCGITVLMRPVTSRTSSIDDGGLKIPVSSSFWFGRLNSPCGPHTVRFLQGHFQMAGLRSRSFYLPGRLGQVLTTSPGQLPGAPSFESSFERSRTCWARRRSRRGGPVVVRSWTIRMGKSRGRRASINWPQTEHID